MNICVIKAHITGLDSFPSCLLFFVRIIGDCVRIQRRIKENCKWTRCEFQFRAEISPYRLYIAWYTVAAKTPLYLSWYSRILINYTFVCTTRNLLSFSDTFSVKMKRKNQDEGRFIGKSGHVRCSHRILNLFVAFVKHRVNFVK